MNKTEIRSSYFCLAFLMNLFYVRGGNGGWGMECVVIFSVVERGCVLRCFPLVFVLL